MVFCTNFANILLADVCLPVPMVELNVDVAVVRPKDKNLCANATFHGILEGLIMSNYLTPSALAGETCQLESIEQTSCKTYGRFVTCNAGNSIIST